MGLDLPSPTSTNGTFLLQQAKASIIRTMITRKDTWHPRYGVNPGYGINMQNGFQDTLVTSHSRSFKRRECLWKYRVFFLVVHVPDAMFK